MKNMTLKPLCDLKVGDTFVFPENIDSHLLRGLEASVVEHRASKDTPFSYKLYYDDYTYTVVLVYGVCFGSTTCMRKCHGHHYTVLDTLSVWVPITTVSTSASLYTIDNTEDYSWDIF